MSNILILMTLQTISSVDYGLIASDRQRSFYFVNRSLVKGEFCLKHEYQYQFTNAKLSIRKLGSSLNINEHTLIYRVSLKTYGVRPNAKTTNDIITLIRRIQKRPTLIASDATTSLRNKQAFSRIPIILESVNNFSKALH